MKLHFAGKFDGNPDSLPHLPHQPGAVPFKEPTDSAQLAKVANAIAVAVLVLTSVPAFFRMREFSFFLAFLPGTLLFFLSLLPHEILHALCFRRDVYLYTDLKNGMLFVTGPEDMSRSRYVLMSLLPNLVFGLIPYSLGMILSVPWLTAFGIMALSGGAGDYYNIFHALTQMPKGARTYLHKFNSFWYLP